MSEDISPLIGRRVGQYQIVGELGRGGMAAVFRARQINMDRDVAIKFLPPHLMDRPGFLERFHRELRVITDLEHPHILPVYDCGETNNIPYIVMRFVDGGTLAARIRKDHFQDIKAIIRPIRQIASALSYAHQQGIIHRDLKPSNVLMDSGGNAYLADFGIARIIQDVAGTDAEGGGLTGTNIVGTPDYMAPEQASGLPVDARADIYALGVMLFEMLTSEKPYQSDTPMGILIKKMTEPVPPPADLRPGLPPPINAVVLRATAQAADDRFPSVDALAEAFEAAAGGTATAADLTELGLDLTSPTLSPQEVAQRDEDIRIMREELAAALHGPDWRARDSAIDDLVKLGEPGIGPLLDALQSLPDRVKPQIARALGRIGSPRALKPLVRLYRTGEHDNEIREAAIEAVGAAADESMVGVLVSALYDDWWKTRAAASRALIRIGAPARDRVAPLLNDEDERIREAAAHILNAIGAPDDAGEPDKEIGALVRSLRAPDTEAREKAARTLESIHWEPETDADRMWYAVAKKDWETVTGFGESAIDALIAALDDEDRRTRRTLINLIPRFGAPAIDPLVQKLLYGDAKLRPAVARMLSQMGKEAVAPLIVALRDPDAGVRQAAAAALGEIGTAAVDPLLDAVRNGDNAVRRAAVDALGRVGVPAVSPILRMLNDLKGDARAAASEALQKIGENQRGSDSVIKPLR